MACVSAPPTTVPAPANNPRVSPAQPEPAVPATPVAAPVPVVPTPRSGSWAFTYTPGTYTYIFTTDATIAPISDTTQKRPVPELNESATITISTSGDVQVVDPAPVTSASCDTNAALTVRAQQLIPKLPTRLTAADHWRDSTTTTGCRGMIPAESQVTSDYVVIGDTTFANAAAVQVHRIDSLSAAGEGMEGQHRILVTATGVGVVDLFFDVATGHLIGSHGVQTSLINVTTSGRLEQFIQHVSESVAIMGPR